MGIRCEGCTAVLCTLPFILNDFMLRITLKAACSRNRVYARIANSIDGKFFIVVVVRSEGNLAIFISRFFHLQKRERGEKRAKNLTKEMREAWRWAERRRRWNCER